MKSFIGVIIGSVNAFFGSGGGLITVPYLKKQGLTQQQAQASSTFIILPLCMLSSLLYGSFHSISFSDFLPLFLAGIAGAVCGGIFLKRIPSKWLKLLFGAFMLYAGLRMISDAS